MSSNRVIDDLEPFESPKLLLNAAWENLSELERACASFLRSCDYEVIRHRDNKTGEEIIKLRFSQRIPGSLRVLASNLLNNTRHALDQSVCDAAIELGRKDARGIHYPIGKDASDLEQCIKNRCRNVHSKIIDFIRTTRPYYGGNDLLRTLFEISGPNKHIRILRLCLDSDGWILTSNERLDILGPATLGINKWNALRNELEYARIAPGGHFQMDINQPVQIVMGEGLSPLNRPATTVLRDFLSMSQSIVTGLEAETARIKAHL